MKRFIFVVLFLIHIFAFGQVPGKLWISGAVGDVMLVDQGQYIEDPEPGIYPATGLKFVTGEKSTVVGAYSNGVGLAIYENTRGTVLRYDHDRFIEDRRDAEAEPAITRGRTHIDFGTVAICTNRLRAGTSLKFTTKNAEIVARDGRMVITKADGETRLYVLEGWANVRGAPWARAASEFPERVEAGYVATTDDHGVVKIAKLERDEEQRVRELVVVACEQKKRVYFYTESVGEEGAGEVVATRTLQPESETFKWTVSPSRLE